MFVKKKDMEEKRYFSASEEVAHKDNLGLKMEVSRVIKEYRNVIHDRGNSKVVEKKCFIVGIECKWWDGGKRCIDVFHSKTLVPWDVAEEGHIAVVKYLNL